MTSDLSKNGFNFKDIVFGKADASKEINNPQLLIDGYLDAYGYIDQILGGDKYYVFGQKGSGKSAIGSKLELMSKTNDSFAASVFLLEQFDYRGFSGVIPGKDEPSKKNIQTWEFLLAVKFIEMYGNNKGQLSSDKGVNYKKSERAWKRLDY